MVAAFATSQLTGERSILAVQYERCEHKDEVSYLAHAGPRASELLSARSDFEKAKWATLFWILRQERRDAFLSQQMRDAGFEPATSCV
jgi:hypothetical protein